MSSPDKIETLPSPSFSNRNIVVFAGITIGLLFVPMLIFPVGLLVLILAPFCFGYRLLKWNNRKTYPALPAFSGVSILLGVFLTNFPNIIIKNGWDWWMDTAQIYTFLGLLVWIVITVLVSFLTERRHCLTLFFSIACNILVVVLFAMWAEAGDLKSLSSHFEVMRIIGIVQAALAGLALMLFLIERVVKRSHSK